MYVTNVNQVFALDAASGRQIWQYRRERTKGMAGDAASGINRGVAVLGDRVFLSTDNAHLIALHRVTGALLWDVETADYKENYGLTSAPLVVNDLVISGSSGGDEGAPRFHRCVSRPTQAKRFGSSGRFLGPASQAQRRGRVLRSSMDAAQRG